MKISATILTYNEERRIASAIESLAGIADEIIVVDSYSTDSTVEICKRYGCRVSQRRLAGFGAQRQYATSLASHSYVLAIDADEELSPALRESLLKLKEEGAEHRVYAFSRLNFYCGYAVKHCGWSPDVQIRLFDKRYANWNLRDVHERVIFRDSVSPEVLEGEMLHYRCDTPEEYADTTLRHAHLEANAFKKEQGRISALTPLAKATRRFLHTYFSCGGVFDGAIGFAIARHHFKSTIRAFTDER